MRMLVALALASLVGCDAGGFNYKATIDLDAYSTPTIQSVAVNGSTVTTPHSLWHTFVDFEISAESVDTVDIVTTTGTYSFALTPSKCGDACGHTGEPSCSDLASESETWDFFAEGSDNPAFAFDPDEGQCDFYDDSSSVAWAY